jgi:hypothetical protein
MIENGGGYGGERMKRDAGIDAGGGGGGEAVVGDLQRRREHLDLKGDLCVLVNIVHQGRIHDGKSNPILSCNIMTLSL